jgi:hypothetical protein
MLTICLAVAFWLRKMRQPTIFLSRIESLSLTVDEFTSRLLARIPATPPNHLRIVELNEAGQIPESGVTELEAGANRCAAG